MEIVCAEGDGVAAYRARRKSILEVLTPSGNAGMGRLVRLSSSRRLDSFDAALHNPAGRVEPVAVTNRR